MCRTICRKLIKLRVFAQIRIMSFVVVLDWLSDTTVCEPSQESLCGSNASANHLAEGRLAVNGEESMTMFCLWCKGNPHSHFGVVRCGSREAGVLKHSPVWWTSVFDSREILELTEKKSRWLEGCGFPFLCVTIAACEKMWSVWLTTKPRGNISWPWSFNNTILRKRSCGGLFTHVN